ncbi:DUF732 domain-containing protein [Mycobacterium malmoense]|uniref:DUF732 domain-containing protein n=1 Tax=Mycobacterium malmoense TaxID=1780 RepID=A0ABX3SW49_MYCMA|nr:DUF732 domain-containing protein [Mycobacterium malmoense]OIN80985.1 hypothetical protein BMG05_09645 [Mycobacterium malmoense]ORA84826.1 hypothetical protein BST29_04545 [Mycobacterium malmoense]QZA19695.1 DUF732 domain-containing protein [Mycobacterium malmoense]UNB96447.1 DUF732 domain-containing protein [Mycobacterium malmoense]
MAPTNVGPAKWSTVCAVLLSAATLLCAAPASADETDDAFTAALTNYGIVISDGTAISMAHTVCTGFDKGQTSTVLAMKLKKDTNLSLKEAGYFIGASVSAYCPQYKGATDDSVFWLLPGPPLM